MQIIGPLTDKQHENHTSESSFQKCLPWLCCPMSGEPLKQAGNMLYSESGEYEYRVSESGIPMFAEKFCSADAMAQGKHYDKVAEAYVENLTYPHTQEYMAYLDRALLAVVPDANLGTVAEICCGKGEAFSLLSRRINCGIGVDISLSMLKSAQKHFIDAKNLSFVQGDATMLPIAGDSMDAVFMLGGIHHVNDRVKLFSEIARILKPGGKFYYREPVSDFFLWRFIRWFVYRLSPSLDHTTERPLVYEETVPVLEKAGLLPLQWKTCGFLGFCIFMNSDILVFNRYFRYIPGIRTLTRISARMDDWLTELPPLRSAGLQVVGVARKPRH